MSDLINHAKRELELINAFSEKGDFYGGETGKAVMELIEMFSKQGHSGGSAPTVISLFSKLANFKPLTPVQGTDDEWNEIGEDLYQNNRYSAVFKHKKDNICTYNDAIIKRCENGSTWSGPLYLTKEDAIKGENRIEVKIKSFPFVPKTFYIDVIEEELKKDDWVMWVKNPKQLKEVYKYYDKI